jgi:hypothetical protein
MQKCYRHRFHLLSVETFVFYLQHLELLLVVLVVKVLVLVGVKAF